MQRSWFPLLQAKETTWAPGCLQRLMRTPQSCPGQVRAGKGPVLNSRFHPDLPALYQRPGRSPS